nr:PREDICTED: lysosomal thioesterase PPT2 homolog [Bemisia tabaci]XP_018907932.1 PREDICTED: lysosomal thioesterase PPT2 homolog [Bemisia tabaci]
MSKKPANTRELNINEKWVLLFFVATYGHLIGDALATNAPIFQCKLVNSNSNETDQSKGSNLQAKKPVFLVHGLFDASLMLPLKHRIQEAFPGTMVELPADFSGFRSMTALDKQVKGSFGEKFRNFSDRHPGGITVIGYSQGAILARAFIQSYPQHNVDNFIAVAGPLDGQYGFVGFNEFMYEFLELGSFLGYTSNVAYDLFAQNYLSLANMWHDPFQQERHLKYNTFLSTYNNLVSHERSDDYKNAFVKLRKLITITGPNDLVLYPWKSGEFAYYSVKATSHDRIIDNFTEREIYIKDTFGLKTLHELGRIINIVHPGLSHLDWVTDDYVIDNFILPNLA